MQVSPSAKLEQLLMERNSSYLLPVNILFLLLCIIIFFNLDFFLDLFSSLSPFVFYLISRKLCPRVEIIIRDSDFDSRIRIFYYLIHSNCCCYDWISVFRTLHCRKKIESEWTKCQKHDSLFFRVEMMLWFLVMLNQSEKN